MITFYESKVVVCLVIDLFEVVDRRAKSVVEDLSEEQSDLQASGTY